ncbi:MAG: tyrosine-type recombinase/integrase, partial [Ornithinimicrobium sp.]
KRRPDGKWRARYRDEAGREHAKHFLTKSAAQRWLDEVTADIVTGSYVSPTAGRITFIDYFDRWLEHKTYEETSRRSVTLAAHCTTFGSMQIGSIRPSHVDGWIADMHRRGLAPGTIRTRVGYVRAVFKTAVRDRVIAHDPTEGVRPSNRGRPSGELVIPTTADMGALMRAADDDFRTFIGLCAFAGLRLGEAAALRVEDVNFLGQSLHVRRQVQRVKGGGVEVRAPKQGSSRRVSLAPALLDLLAEHIRRRGIDEPTTYLFETGSGAPPHQNTVGHQWRRLRRECKLPDVKLHNLRHFYASGLIHAGCDVVVVQKALGHSKPSITLDTYSHLWPSADDRTRTAAASLMDQACGAGGWAGSIGSTA